MSSAFYPLGMNSKPASGYNHDSTTYNKQYSTWKGTGVNSNPVGTAPGHIRPLTNNDPGNVFQTGFGLARPIKHFRKGRVIPPQPITGVPNLNGINENALINYLCHTMAGIQCPRGITGDVSMENGGFWQKQRPFGCCYPRFYFVKLIPKVSKNTIMYSDHYIQMEYYLRAMCNGFINKGSEMNPGQVEAIIRAGLTGINMPGGYDSAIGDYLFEDLMRDSYDNSGDQSLPISPNMVGRQ